MTCKTRAFTLLEIMISLGILLTSVLIMMALFTRVFGWAQKTADTTPGVLAADGLISRHLYEDLSSDASRRALFDGVQAGLYASPAALHAGTTTNPTGTRFDYTLRAVYLGDIGNSPGNRLARVDAEVVWSPNPSNGPGKLRVQLSRIVNENSRY